ncbi:glycosyltransferase [Halobacterium sp. R2-5]|uniref:glycosyltransferase n=1 Tax=Halobacterium sp. R2-5 TaxID=2715751 RepID=UPI001422242F|nr:glycosyltransferase [Halobacterium sp. R2-5]NIC00468.1 glycosyltransferase family 2 protein [Halobacterium sp. R2-5]
MPPPTSVLLPTVTWAPACEEVAAQLAPEDELLVLCDTADDPVAGREDLPENVDVVLAGEPERCSGKANAIAAGMEAAEHDRIAWTDDDFHHPPDWLATLHADYERHGPVSELPVFVGRDPLARLLEPLYAVGGTLGVYLGDQAWAGAVLFERGDLDEATFLADLRRTVSDDGVLSEHVDVTPLRRTRRVEVGGTIRRTLERHVRFTKIVHRHDPGGHVWGALVTLATFVACLLVPLYAAVGLTALVAGVYAAFGIRRWTVVIAYPAALAAIPFGVYAHVRRTFVWGGRRYRWRGKYDVEVVDD